MKNGKRIHSVTIKRMEDLNQSGWCYIGIGAEAEVSIPTGTFSTAIRGGEEYRIYQTIQSGGLWGIESDSDNDYLESVEKEELAELRSQLTVIGFSSRAISTAFKTIERKEE